MALLVDRPDFEGAVMKKYYVAMAAYVDGHKQSDCLCILNVNNSALVGYAAEFDSCTQDIGLACELKATSQATWFGWDEEWEWQPATFEQIKTAGLEGVLIGCKVDMKLCTPITPL